MDRRWIKKPWARMTALFVICLVVASCKTTSLSNPCDVLVNVTPKPATNTYLIQNDRATAVNIARIRGRYAKYSCSTE